MIDVTVSDQQEDHEVDGEAVAGFVAQVAETVQSKADEVSVALVDETEIRRFNNEYRGMDRVTDVLSFSLEDGPGPDGRHNLGDLVVCPSRAAEQAREAGHPLWTEIRILLLHGFLHLSGMDHPESADDRQDASAMELEEVRLRGLLIRD